MHGPGQTSSIFRLNVSKEQKIRQMEENPDAECSALSATCVLLRVAARFMGNKEKDHSVCPWRLLFKELDHFRGFSPTHFPPICALSLFLSPWGCEVYINTDEASITYSDWIRVAAFAGWVVVGSVLLCSTFSTLQHRKTKYTCFVN